MHDPAAALRPIREAADAIRRLEEYENPEDLSSALVAVRAAVERSLRLRLRSDTSAPDDDRLSALSADRTIDQVVQSLRSRELISLRLAGTVHELRSAVERARVGRATAADADLALRAVAGVREELVAKPAEDVPVAPPDAPASAGSTAADPSAEPPERRGRWVAWLAAGLAALALLLLAWSMMRGSQDDYDRAIAAFRADRLDSAAVAFQRVLEDRPEDVSAMLYLGRIHRRQGRRSDAADVLGRAARIAPSDPDVRRELGHLFMDLGRPTAAAEQYQLAVDHEPEETRNWIPLIRALRAAGDPRAERLLRDAPADVQAAFGSTGGN